jgi:hypothetical protein
MVDRPWSKNPMVNRQSSMVKNPMVDRPWSKTQWSIVHGQKPNGRSSMVKNPMVNRPWSKTQWSIVHGQKPIVNGRSSSRQSSLLL